MKRRKKANDGGIIGAVICGLAEMVFSIVAWVITCGLFGIFGLVRRGLCWIVEENRDEVARLNEERREKLEALERKLHGEDEEEAEEEEEEDEEPEDPDELDELDELEDMEEEEEAEDCGFASLLHGRSIEKAIEDEERRLLALYRRKDKAEYVNGADAKTWEKYQNTKTYRGLLWEIDQAEDTIARLEQLAGLTATV